MSKKEKKLQEDFTNPPQEVIDEYRKKLVNDFRVMKDFEDDPDAVASEIIEKALKGWGRAPKEFKGRVERLVSLRANSKSLKKKVDKESFKERNEDLLEERAYKGKFTNSLLNSLSAMEQNHYLEREKFYVDEFEFNMSSDIALLNNMLMEEIIIRKIQLKILEEGGTKELSQQLSDAQKRHMEAAKALGITRDQRKHDKGKGEGSIASISKDLENKLAKRKIELEEEELLKKQYLKDKEDRDPSYRGIHTKNRIRDADIDSLIEGIR